MLLIVLAGCGLPRCEELCATQAGCVQDEIDAQGSTWSEWTGFADRGAFEDGCLAVFEDSLDQGAPRDTLQDTCRDALDADPCDVGQ
jgi:hypothetical protein